jgi:hypothetical protein
VPVGVALAVVLGVGVGITPSEIVKLHVLTMSWRSVHVHVTVVTPRGNVLPDGGVQSKLLIPLASAQLAMYVTGCDMVAPGTAMSAGQLTVGRKFTVAVGVTETASIVTVSGALLAVPLFTTNCAT